MVERETPRAPDDAAGDGDAVRIAEADGAADCAAARELFVEYARWLKVDLCFQGFDEELATLPGKYARPTGRLLLARTASGELAGCVALRALPSDESGGSLEYLRADALRYEPLRAAGRGPLEYLRADALRYEPLRAAGRGSLEYLRADALRYEPLRAAGLGSCELKRLWVRPQFRRLRLGRRLTAAALDAAREIGYRSIKLDTLASIMPDAVALYRSFGFVECAPYYRNPIEGTLYMERSL